MICPEELLNDFGKPSGLFVAERLKKLLHRFAE
jgi:hypothetical protein